MGRITEITQEGSDTVDLARASDNLKGLPTLQITLVRDN